MAQSSVVIKVKYGDTLRRFSALINEDQKLDLDMERLRTKICSLYNFTPDSDFILTYIDDDDDRVTLADDEDLYDVARQGLDPVRIFVHLNVDKNAQNSGKPTESSTPRGSPSQTPQNINPHVTEILKSVPEPLCDALSKLSLELASKAATTPFLEDLINSLSKVGHSYLNESPSPSGTSSMVSSRGMDGINADEGIKQDGIRVTSSEQPTAVSSQVPVPHAVKGARLKFRSPHHPRHPRHPCLLLRKGKHPNSGHLRYMPMGDGIKKDKEIIEDSNGKFKNNMNDTRLPTDDFIKKERGIMGEKQMEAREAPLEKHVSSKKETNEAKLGVNQSARGSYLVGKCPFSRVPLVPTPEQASYMHHIIKPSNRSPNHSVDVTGSIFHTGVNCDGCGVVPITGLRFKSKVKHNYDLCTVCFSRMGNDADYDRLDFPLPRHHLWASKGSYNPIFGNLPSMMRNHGPNNLRPRLDSHFIMDVNIWDGTLMAPSTPFTKIWRMQNNGTLPWARGLQLVWIGGDRFNASDCVEIEIPEEGVNVSFEIDIAVDFIAPELPGRYNSYWRMSDPNGHKFGQRVWVLIEVDASLEDSSDKPSPVNASFASPVMDLNLPPGNIGSSLEEGECSHVTGLNLDMNAEAEEDLRSAPKTTTPRVDPTFDRSSEKESIALMVEHHKRRIEMEEMNFPINNDLLVASKGSSSPSPISYPEIDVIYPQKPANYISTPINAVSSPSTPQPFPTSFPFLFSVTDADKPASASSSVTYPIIDMNGESLSSPIVAAKDDEKRENDMEETLLKELKEMGFDEVNLNREVLRANEYDMQRSVDELCGVAGWDPILEELKEMGFEDKEINKKLLVKYNGSVTRVVMDLITGEKQLESFLGI